MWKQIKKKLFQEKCEIDYLVVGLGNPGEKYQKTAHNAGFRVVSHLREVTDFPPLEKDNTLNALKTKGKIEDKTVVLLLPLTYMNLSGDAVKKALKRFNPALENLILVHDDIDLLIGTLRFSFSRGSAGHKGVASVIKSVGTKDFMRLRIGVSKKIEKEENKKAIDVVLKNLSPDAEKAEKRAAEELKEGNSSKITTKTVNV